MSKIKLIVFDLSGTTVEDDNAVARSLYNAAIDYGLEVSLEDFQKSIGTNKIHLYQYMIARNQGKKLEFKDFEQYEFPELYKEAKVLFDRYSAIMLAYYHQNIKAMPGAEETFAWCRSQNIKIATDTGFHQDINQAIMDGLGWLAHQTIDLSVTVESTQGKGRPAPYMIFYAMQKLGIQSVHEVIKIGDTPADLLSAYHAGCIGNIGVLSGANEKEVLENHPHTHIIPSVKELPELIQTVFA